MYIAMYDTSQHASVIHFGIMILQVGCTPEDDGFSPGPRVSEQNETIEEWCPCNIAFNPTYMGETQELDTEFTYPVQDGTCPTP